MKNLFIAAAAGLLLWAAGANAQTAVAARGGGARTTDDIQDAGELTVITSERLTVDNAKFYALFETNVVVSDPQMKMKSDKLTVTFDEKHDVKHIEAEGNVVLSQSDKRAWAGRATYDVVSGQVTLEKNPRVMRDKDLLEGNQIIFWRDSNKMVVDKRVRMVVYPDKNEKRDIMNFGTPKTQEPKGGSR